MAVLARQPGGRGVGATTSPHHRPTIVPTSYHHHTTIVLRSQGWLRRDGRRKCPEIGQLSGTGGSWGAEKPLKRLNLPLRPQFTSLKRGVNEKAAFMIVYYGGRERGQLAGALVGAGRSTAAASCTRSKRWRAIHPLHPPACPAPRDAFPFSISRPALAQLAVDAQETEKYHRSMTYFKMSNMTSITC